MQRNNNKVIVVGLDGGTFTLLQPLMDEGKMPNLKQIITNGASGILKSTIPPITAPAWSTFATGKNPGKHGAYDFIVRNKNNEMVVINSKMIRGKKIWNILSDYNKKVGIIHFPISYPPEEVNGFMISGFISPATAQDYTYPIELYSEILKEIGNYVFNVKVPPYKRWRKHTQKELKTFLNKLIEATELRYRTFKYLSKTREWHFLFVLFHIFDKIQHVLWKYLDSKEADYMKGEIYEHLMKCYKMVDNILGDLLKNLDEETALFIVSDHGFCSKKKLFYINVWLEENGFLKKNMKKLILDKIKSELGLKSEKLYEGLPMEVVKLFNFLKLQKTKAYSPNTCAYDAVCINLKGRERFGIVEEGEEFNRTRNELKNKLLEVRDEETGENIIKNVFFPEQIYKGPFVKSVPDLILSPADGYSLTDSLLSLRRKNLVKVTNSDGTHHPDGIFIALNSKIINNGMKVHDFNIADVAPTILYLMGLPVPSDMDGKVVTSIFEDKFIEANPLKFSDPTPEINEIKEEGFYSANDERKIIDELKGLGYID